MEETPLAASLVGHNAVADLFCQAVASQRLHHAWLLCGPNGVGKAHFAWQAAAYLLSGASQQSSLLGASNVLADFSEAMKSQAAGQMLAGSHPDFQCVTPDESKAKALISIEQIRTLAGMFVTTAGMGGWRVAIIDAADDMNRNAANAILKLLEEPPEKCLFFLISHAPGRLLPTIRSRCQTLLFKALAPDQTHAIVSTLKPDADEIDIQSVVQLSQGSPGRAIELLEGNAADYLVTVDRLFQSLPSLDQTSVLGLADLVGDRTSAGPFDMVWELIEGRIRYAVKASAAGHGQEAWIQAIPLVQWISLQESMGERKGQASGLNLSPRHVLLALFGDLNQLLKRAA